jgi:hypothetical protein
MPPTFVRRTPIDLEWAEALVGLRLNVPNSWWPGFVDGGLNRGQIAAVNLDAPNEYYFKVELDDELGAHYAMRYDSVLLYADKGQPLQQGSASELPPALPHLSSQQRICIDDGNKLISIKLTII